MKKLRSRLVWSLAALVLMVGAAFFRHHHELYTIPQDGMFPDLPAGTRFWVTRHPYRSIDDVHRGDVIVFQRGGEGARTDHVWRVIGLPGERIAIRQDAVLVNGQPLPRAPLRDEGGLHIFKETAGEQSYRIALPARLAPESELDEVTVPAGHVFVLGDNRHHAADSRTMGPVAFGSIVARAGLGR
jgi:signal peptidase I